ncbi:FAD binding domain-containing protein [Acidihalobacter prosperus]
MWARPQSLAEALRLLEEASERPCVIAGGTDLMVERQLGKTPPPESWLDLGAVDELRGIEAGADSLRIGATATLRAVGAHPEIRARWPMLAASAALTGATPIQNRATLGGNIVNASPAADNPPVLLAYGAELELAGPRGTRRLPYAQFHTGYRRTALAADELLVAVRLPAPAPGVRQYFRKVGTRQAQAIAKLSLAALYEFDAEGRIAAARFGMASVAATPAGLPQLAAWLCGRDPAAVDPAALGECLARDIAPIDDIRSSGRYRLQTAARLVLESLAPQSAHA